MTPEQYPVLLEFLAWSLFVIAIGALVSDYIIQPWLDKRGK